MNSDMYPKAMERRGIELVLPSVAERARIQEIIFPELEEGIVDPVKKREVLWMAEEILRKEGAEAVILGCTELPLMIKTGDLSVDLLNTTEIHVDAILDYLAGEDK